MNAAIEFYVRNHPEDDPAAVAVACGLKPTRKALREIASVQAAALHERAVKEVEDEAARANKEVIHRSANGSTTVAVMTEAGASRPTPKAKPDEVSRSLRGCVHRIGKKD